ncbi:hypothetical protein CCP3SC15_1390015 [Gammaproteobacteria bacterium]
MLKMLPRTVILNMTVDEQNKLVKDCVALQKRISDATEAHKLSIPMAGKVVYGIQKRLEYEKSSTNPDGSAKKPTQGLNTSLNSYWESITRSNGKPGVKLNPHWLSCAVTIGTYVDSELITEKDYDDNPASHLELAASISTAVGHELENEHVLAAAEELRHQTKDTTANLKAILAKVKEPTEMTAEKAQDLVKRIISHGHLNLLIAAVGAEIAHLTDPEAARNAFYGMLAASAMFAANVDEKGARRFSDEVLNAWSASYDAANQQPEETDTDDTGTPETEPEAEPAGATS